MNEYLENLTRYLSAMTLCQELLDRKIISDDEYEMLRQAFAQRHGCSTDTVYGKIT